MIQDTDRILHPLRLAVGSHKPGSGKGCAMNVISYINGDVEITDFPQCSAQPLAYLVQQCNDRLGDEIGYLSPENSLIVLDLGYQTIGTAGVEELFIHTWIDEVLGNPEWGMIVHLPNTITHRINMHRKLMAESFVGWTATGFANTYLSFSLSPYYDRPSGVAEYIEFTRKAIHCWRQLAGLDQEPIEYDRVNDALALMKS